MDAERVSVFVTGADFVAVRVAEVVFVGVTVLDLEIEPDNEREPDTGAVGVLVGDGVRDPVLVVGGVGVWVKGGNTH